MLSDFRKAANLATWEAIVVPDFREPANFVSLVVWDSAVCMFLEHL